MFRAHWKMPVVVLFLITACSPSGEESGSEMPVPSAKPDEIQAKDWRESHAVAGKETYETACASCHDRGEGDAPAIGDKSAWSDRSGLWVAVLSEHASAGYLDMPEKGGHGELTDESVAAAVEYMMMKTFPEKPVD